MRNSAGRTTRLYPTAEAARRAVADAAHAEGHQPNPHTWLGAICDEAECYCGVQMPLHEDGSPSLTFEDWNEYHDQVSRQRLDTDENPGVRHGRTRVLEPSERGH